MEGKTGQQLQDKARELQDKARELQAKMAPQMEEAKRNLSDLNDRMTSFIRERPGACLAGALALGFVIGKIAARR